MPHKVGFVHLQNKVALRWFMEWKDKFQEKWNDSGIQQNALSSSDSERKEWEGAEAGGEGGGGGGDTPSLP